MKTADTTKDRGIVREHVAGRGWLRRLVRLLCRWRYGVRGAIKPPLNWNRANSVRYRIRYKVWKIEERIYQWSGLPDEWWKAVTGKPNR